MKTASFLGRSTPALFALLAVTRTGEALSEPTGARTKMIGPPRPTYTEETDLDYRALPLTEPSKLTHGPEEKFSIRAPFIRFDGTRTGSPDSLVLAAPDASVRIGNMALVTNQVLWIRERRLSGTAEWYVVDDAATSADTALVTRYQGKLVDGLAVAQSAEVVRAVAVLPGKLYAFRRVVADGEAPREELGIVAPHALWTGASDALTDPNDNVTSPAHIVRTAPIERGSSASLSVVLEEQSRSASRPLMRRTVVDIDAIWPTEGDPTCVLFVGSATGTREAVAPRHRF